MRRLFLLAAVAASLTGCDTSPPGNAMRDNASGFDSSSGLAMPDGGNVQAPGGAPPAARGAAAVALAPDGLALVDPDSGNMRQLAFGTAQRTVFDALTRAVGAPTARGTSPECPAGPVETADFPGGLSVVFQDGKFVGWDAGSGSGFRTMSGIGLGSSRSALETAYDTSVAESSLGEEFQAGGLSGLLSSDAPDASVTNFWAGTVCVYR